MVRLEAAARPDAEELLDAELDQLLDDDHRARTAHAGALDRHRLALPLARVPEETTLGVHVLDVREERLRDVLRAQRVAGEEAGLRVVARLRTEVDRHGGSLWLRPRRWSRTALVEFAVVPRRMTEPEREQIL